MAKERENFGFYFAAHPVQQYHTIASANGARSYGSLMASGAPGGRTQAVMAAMVENVQRRKTKRGKDYAVAEFSDNTGQFSASCFEETLVEPLLRWAGDGTCLLLTVELDSPSPEEPPRVTVRGARPLAEVTSAAQMVLKLDIDRVDAVQELALMLVEGATGRGEVLARLKTGGAHEPVLRLGRDFQLDGDLAERLAQIDGVHNVSLSARRGASHLRLVA
jgi:DNA polymerase-3 subunit alpha